MNNIRQRLIDIAKYKGVSVRAFEELCGLNRGNISNLAINGNIGSDKLSKIIDAIPEIDSEWLLTGRGKMLAEGIQRGWPISQLDNNTEIEMRPRIPLDAAAGSLSIMAESVSDAECERYPVIPRFPRYDFTIMVKGDSMEPEFQSGDEIACRLIDQPSFIQWGRPHVLDTTQGVVLKRIYNKTNTILCHSDNNLYQDFEIPKGDILHIAIVVGTVRLY
jgi:phage repressor protein C with HTH and peptisase S24 domain